MTRLSRLSDSTDRAATAAEADELCALARARNLILAVYHNRRFDGDLLTLQRLMRDRPDALGEIVSFESAMDRYRPEPKPGNVWRERAEPGSGVLFDLGSHLLDQALLLFGWPASVTGFVRNSRGLGDPNVDDSFEAKLHYPASAKRSKALEVTVRASPFAAEAKRLRYRVRGTRGAFVKYGVDPQEDQLKVDPPLPLRDSSFGVGASASLRCH